MAFADGLDSSDGLEPEDMSAAGGSNSDGNNFDNSEGAGTISRSHSRQSSLAFSSSPGPGSFPSVLGRRQRELGQQTWSSREKVHIRDFAADKCAEYELSGTDRKSIMNDSQVSFLFLLPKYLHHSEIVAVNARASCRLHVQICSEQVGFTR